jgi:predicted alpha/beta-fold hydrolase
MPIVKSRFKSFPFLRNKHLQTILPALLLMQRRPHFQRERLELPDKDFLDLDWLISDPSWPLFILCHGLEGSSGANYIARTATYLRKNKYNVLAWNYRGCSGEMNRSRRFYHSGETSDLNHVITYCHARNYKTIFLMGFSLGGNVVLKYTGEQSRKALKPFKAAVTVSAPIDLASCAERLQLSANRIYLNRFLVSLKNKIKSKSFTYPDLLQNSSLEGIKDFFTFDDAFTAPIHGFTTALEYYALASSKPWINELNIPTLLIQPANDPFLSPESYPRMEAEQNSNFYLEIPTSGGHLGFPGLPFLPYYPAWKAVEFVCSLNVS